MGFRTVSTHGMKTTARVNPFLSLLTTRPLCLNTVFQGWVCIFQPIFPICFSYSLTIFLYLLPPPEKRSKGLFHQITKTHGTVIGVSSGIVLVLLIISILVQMKQPRKKVTHPLYLTFFFFFGGNLEIARGEMTHSQIK